MWRKLFLITISLLTMTSCAKGSSNDSFVASQKASTTPFGRYDKTVTYTLAHLTSHNNSNMPKGDTYENNAYTRYLKKKLNVQNKDVIQATDTTYDTSVEHAILSKNIPDVMIVDNLEDLQYLYKHDMIADLSTAYKNCASKRIKAMYNSYGSAIFNNVSFNGHLYAMPETNIDDGPNLFWCRRDWLKKYHLAAPKTLSDVEHIVSVFNQKRKTDGLMVDTSLTAGTGASSEYLLNLYFASAGVYPQQWVMKNGKITYGSINTKAKGVLEHLSALYKKGIIDSKFLMRTSENISQEIIAGKCGAFFGPWWVPNNPLIKAINKNANQQWQPYRIATNSKGETYYHAVNPSSKYVVVRKGFKHPEVIFKTISVIFDYLRYTNKSVDSINRYYALNVDPTARPISINVDYSNALDRSHESITYLLNGGTVNKNISSIDVSYATACRAYLQGKKTNRSENWAAYYSRVIALGVLDKKKIKKVKTYSISNTQTTLSKGYSLRQLEKETYLKIISGKASPDSFDEFVTKWLNDGGRQITKEINEQNKK